MKKTSTLGRILNGALLAILLLLLAACAYSFFNPTPDIANYPAAYNAFMYFCVIPLFFCVTALVLSDKTWIKQHVVLFRSFKWWHWIVFYLACIGILMIATGIAGAATAPR